MRDYFEAITCIVDFERMKFKRIVNLSDFLSSGAGLSDTEEDYKGETLKRLDGNTISLEIDTKRI